MGELRIELEGPADGELAAVKRMGCITEIVSWRRAPRNIAPGGVLHASAQASIAAGNHLGDTAWVKAA